MNPVDHAYGTIKSRLESGAWQAGEKLPSIINLARMCRVSRTTMWKALKALQKELLLHAKQRGAIIAGPPGIPRLPQVPAGTVSERVKSHIARDIRSGAYPLGKLPFVNKLAARHAVSSITVKKALHQLALEGILAGGGHRYSVAAGHAHRRTAKIILISAGNDENRLLLADFRTRQIVESFEREILEHGYESRFSGFNERAADCLLQVQRILRKHADIEGFIVHLWNPWDQALRNRWFDLFHHLASRKLPVAILDQSGNFVLPDHLSTSPFIRMLRIAGISAGETTARALIHYGHRHSAFITPYAAHHWVQDRYAGLCRHMEQYGHPQSTVTWCGLDEIKDLSELILELLDLDKKDIIPLFGRRFAQPGIQDMYTTLDRIRHRKLLPKLDHDLKALTIRSDARYLCELARKPHDADMFGTLYESMYDWASTYALEIYLRPFFEKILKKKEVTAWVCADDKTGLPALPFLAQAGKKVPGDIAVTGFDNWPHDFLEGLSSYDFNMHGMVRQAIRMISDKKEFSKTSPVSTVEGFLVERRSIQAKRKI